MVKLREIICLLTALIGSVLAVNVGEGAALLKAVKDGSEGGVPYVGYNKLSLKLDCYLGMGFRAGGCDNPDLRNHELRLANLENAGYKTHKHTKQIGKQVEVLKDVAGQHQTLHESVFNRNRNVRPSIVHARALLKNFPDARPARLAADSAWKRVFKERILKPITLVDWAEIMISMALVLIIVFKLYGYLRKRRSQSVHIHTNQQKAQAQTNVETV